MTERLKEELDNLYCNMIKIKLLIGNMLANQEKLDKVLHTFQKGINILDKIYDPIRKKWQKGKIVENIHKIKKLKRVSKPNQ